MNIGKYIIIIGIVIVVIGLLVWRFGNIFSWFGNLPGDIRIEKGSSRFYFPVGSCILISIVLSIVLWLVRKFL
jgi:H+/Cl- antiporter ClcA